VTRTWVLNPGAEREVLAGKSAPDQRTVAQMRERSSLFDDLCAGEPRAWLADLGRERRYDGRALLWCPTPAAVEACAAAGLVPQPAPRLDVLERVLSKAFLSTALEGRTPPHHQVVHSVDEYRVLRSKVSVPLRAKPLDGYAGKGQRTLHALSKGGDELWILQRVQSGGFVVEAELEPVGEFSVHGVVTGEAALIGQPCRIHTDDARAPLTAPTACPDLPRAEEIRELGLAASRALAGAFYRGPFGLDLIETREGLYATDLNARFTLGFSAGLGPLREPALALVLA